MTGAILLVYLVLLTLYVKLSDSSTARPTVKPSPRPTAKPSPRPTAKPTSKPTSYVQSSQPTVSGPNIIYRNNDRISITSTGIRFIGPWYIDIITTANGAIYDKNGGHFTLDISADIGLYTFTGTTPCITVGSSLKVVTEIIQQTKLVRRSNNNDDDSTSNYVSYDETIQVDAILAVTTKKIVSTDSGITTTTYAITFVGSTVLYLDVNMSLLSCSVAQTYSNWNDATYWPNSIIPTLTNIVYLTGTIGIIQLTSDVTLAGLIMKSGTILASKSGCDEGWSSSVYDTKSYKCYKLFTNETTFDNADNACANSGKGSFDSHLIAIADYNELDLAKRLCRGSNNGSVTTDVVRRHGCWIGLKDKKATGDFTWIDERSVKSTSFRDWRRPGLNNRTISDGVSTDGELCASIVPWQEDPLSFEQGSWNDAACYSSKPYICQASATTLRYTITTMSATSTFDGTATIIGGYLHMGFKSSVKNLIISNSCDVTIAAAATTVGNIHMSDGSQLNILVSVVFTTTAFIGEQVDLVEGLQSKVIVSAPSTSTVVLSSTCALCTPSYEVTFNAQLVILSGILTIEAGVSLNLLQGGDLSAAEVNLNGADAHLYLSGYSTKLSQFESYELKLAHRGDVIGEYSGTYDESESTGVFRLRVVKGTTTRVTTCLKYHATAAEVAAALNSIQLISKAGGVTVRRYDDASNYGHVHRIELDALPTTYFDTNSDSTTRQQIQFHCYGIDSSCNCHDTKVSLIDQDSRSTCPISGKSSRTDTQACVIPPTIEVSPLTIASYTQTTGAGSIIINGGVTRLPPTCSVTISAYSGIGIVAADVITWVSMVTQSAGNILIAGTGWTSWDTTQILFRPSWEKERGLSSLRTDALPFEMYLDSFVIANSSTVISTCPSSTMYWKTGAWSGGIIGGLAVIHITASILLQYNTKELRYGIQLYIDNTASILWTDGHVLMANGATVIIEGEFTVNTNVMYYFGHVDLLKVILEDTVDDIFLEYEPGRSWHGYYDNALAYELRTGWYLNPLCNMACLLGSSITVQESGYMYFNQYSAATFYVPLNLIDTSKVLLYSYGHLGFASGGACGDQVVMTMQQYSILELTGGNVQMGKYCTVQGQGELLISAGEHDLAYQIDAHITIAGGAMVWPISRGAGFTINFNGGLLLNNQGKLQIQAFSTTVVVRKPVYIEDNCNVEFPVTGAAAQPSNFDADDAPDPSARGNFTAIDAMYFSGGTLQGKADFFASSELYLYGGVKRINSLARLVNVGHAEWTTGDISMADGADFTNRGSIQMGDGYRTFNGGNFIKGTVLPISNGGDVFALDFHAHDIDGRLDYRSYTDLRSLFVSRSPEGWSAADQLPNKPK